MAHVSLHHAARSILDNRLSHPKVAKRSEKGAIILSSNKSFSEWGDLFTDQVLATALLDRLLHHATLINIRGQSYRLKEKRQAGLFQPPPALEATAVEPS